MEFSSSEASPARRRYDSSRRQADARARQRRVVDAARELFLQRGYGTTTMDDIAEAADVSVQFVYAAFESKAGILSRVVDVAIAGDDAELLVLERPEIREITAEPDASKRLRALVHMLRLAHERAAPLFELVDTARGGDPALAALADKLDAATRHDARVTIDALPTNALRRDLTRDEAADLLFVVASPRNWTALVERCQWTPEQYEARMTDLFSRLLLRETDLKPASLPRRRSRRPQSGAAASD
jgi:AcrR family transcriptional regulator